MIRIVLDLRINPKEIDDIFISWCLPFQEEGLSLFKSSFVSEENHAMLSALVQPFLSFLFLFVHFCQVGEG